jgi:hypothetical protein
VTHSKKKPKQKICKKKRYLFISPKEMQIFLFIIKVTILSCFRRIQKSSKVNDIMSWWFKKTKKNIFVCILSMIEKTRTTHNIRLMVALTFALCVCQYIYFSELSHNFGKYIISFIFWFDILVLWEIKLKDYEGKKK